jgi:hypothetical protein
MKKALIVTLVCVNAGLLAALLLGTAQPAQAQAYGGADYLVVTAQIAVDWDAVWVLDMAKRRLRAFGFNKQSNRLVPFGGGRDLARDFTPQNRP